MAFSELFNNVYCFVLLQPDLMFCFLLPNCKQSYFPVYFQLKCCVPFMFNLLSAIVLLSWDSVSGHYSTPIKILNLKISPVVGNL